MPPRGPRPPDRQDFLYGVLFEGREPEATLELISHGINAIIDNVTLLVADAELLADNHRYARADFVAAAAREEMGKLHLMLDMCRLDLSRHENYLKRLCGAFFDHITKHAYFEYCTRSHAGIQTMSGLGYHFNLTRQKWWPAGAEDGEPDMPNDVYFLREANLYVGYDDYAKEWVYPDEAHGRIHYDPALSFLGTPIAETKEVFDRLNSERERGFFRAECLGAVNACFKQCFFNESTPAEELIAMHRCLAGDLVQSLETTEEDYMRSALATWPLYSFV